MRVDWVNKLTIFLTAGDAKLYHRNRCYAGVWAESA